MVDGERYENGDDCGGEPGVVQVARWSDALAGGEPRTSVNGLAGTRFTRDSEAFTVAFAPEGTNLPLPPSTDEIAGLLDPSPTAPPTTTAGSGVATPDVGNGFYAVAAVRGPPAGSGRDRTEGRPASCRDVGTVADIDGMCYQLLLEGSVGLGADVLESSPPKSIPRVTDIGSLPWC